LEEALPESLMAQTAAQEEAAAELLHHQAEGESSEATEPHFKAIKAVT
jgi:hypothetical protein